MAVAHPVIAVIVLFVVFFTIFFLLIYGILRFADRRKSGNVSDREIESEQEIPTYSQYKTCSKCGTTMPGVASFCPECGSPQLTAKN